jgi:hypothetical protein
VAHLHRASALGRARIVSLDMLGPIVHDTLWLADAVSHKRLMI